MSEMPVSAPWSACMQHSRLPPYHHNDCPSPAASAAAAGAATGEPGLIRLEETPHPVYMLWPLGESPCTI